MCLQDDWKKDASEHMRPKFQMTDNNRWSQAVLTLLSTPSDSRKHQRLHFLGLGM